MLWLAALAGLLVAYLIGSFPTGYLLGRLRGIDIRQHGSGSTGATNVLRTLGKGPGAVALLADLAKGAAAVLFAGAYYGWLARSPLAAGVAAGPALATWGVALSGLAMLVGHAKPVWLNFAGGKSVAAGFGMLLALSWPVGVGGGAVFLVAVALSRRVSLGSILAAVTAMALVCVLDHPLPYRLLVIAGGAYVIARHRANIGRLLAGTEPRLGQRA